MSRIGGSGATPNWYQPEGVGTDEIKSTIDALRRRIKASVDGSGKLDIVDLEERVDRSGDPALREQFDCILNEFETSTSYSSGCSTSTRTSEPDTLSRNDVQRVLSELTSAKRELNQLDANKDGVLTEGEANEAGYDLGSELLRAAFEERLDEGREAAEAAADPDPVDPDPIDHDDSTPHSSNWSSGC